MAINELNELKINVHLNPEVKIVGSIQQTLPIIANISPGARGKSAYQTWLEQGHNGTEEDFLNWLRSDSYIHNQIAAANEWIVEHNLGKYPSITIVDSAGSVVIGDLEYLTENTIKITFNAAFSGKAYLN